MGSIIVFLALLGLFSGSIVVVRGADQASPIVGDAGSAVHAAFNATLEAERAGANVSDLIASLNEAARLLSDAKTSLSSGNLSEAAIMAGQCFGIAANIERQAGVLKASAKNEAQSVFWTSLTFSVVGIASFIVVLLLLWVWFRRRFTGKVLDMKPEVASNED